jgi:hypothetical protein
MLLGALVATAPQLGRADEAQACSTAYDVTQAQRRAGQFSLARRSAILCSRESCAEFIRVDCAQWLGEIDASQPTVVIVVRDAAGKETSAARVELDGMPWLANLDGKAQPIDPGQHTVRFMLSGDAIEETLQIREGEKNRSLSASFEKKPAPVSSAAISPPAPAAAPPAGWESETPTAVAPWIIGGVGVAGLLVGAIAGGVVLHDRAVVGDSSQCNAARGTCTLAGYDALAQGRALSPVSTAGFVVGGLGVGVSTVWIVARRLKARRAPARMGLAPVTSAAGAMWRLQGAW